MHWSHFNWFWIPSNEPSLSCTVFRSFGLSLALHTLLCAWKLAGGTALNWAGRLEAAACLLSPPLWFHSSWHDPDVDFWHSGAGSEKVPVTAALGLELSMARWSGLGCSGCWEQSPFLGATCAGHSLQMLGRWNVGMSVCWCELSPSPSAWGFFAVTVFPALENSVTWSYVQRNQSLSTNLRLSKCRSPGRCN